MKKLSKRSIPITQAEDSIVVSPDKQTIKVTMQRKANREGIEPFEIIVTRKDNKY